MVKDGVQHSLQGPGIQCSSAAKAPVVHGGLPLHAASLSPDAGSLLLCSPELEELLHRDSVIGERANLSSTQRTCGGRSCARVTREKRLCMPAVQKPPRSHGSAPSRLGPNPHKGKAKTSPTRVTPYADSILGVRRTLGNSGIPKTCRLVLNPLWMTSTIPHAGSAPRRLGPAQQRPHVVGEVHPCCGMQYVCMRAHSNMYPGD